MAAVGAIWCIATAWLGTSSALSSLITHKPLLWLNRKARLSPGSTHPKMLSASLSFGALAPFYNYSIARSFLSCSINLLCSKCRAFINQVAVISSQLCYYEKCVLPAPCCIFAVKTAQTLITSFALK
jgi:hypothetical protein